MKAPPPLGRDEEEQRGSKNTPSPSPRSQPSLAGSPQSTRSSQATLLRDSWVSYGTSSNSRVSQTPSSRTTTSYDTRSFSDNNAHIISGPNSGSGNRLNLAGNTPNILPVAPPMRPFARRDSPASSTGDSSSGRAPLTPRDGSDTRSIHSRPSAMSTRRRRPGVHARNASVTFEDDKGEDKQKDNAATDEIRRKERRRSEARAAIEVRDLGCSKIALQTSSNVRRFCSLEMWSMARRPWMKMTSNLISNIWVCREAGRNLECRCKSLPSRPCLTWV